MTVDKLAQIEFAQFLKRTKVKVKDVTVVCHVSSAELEKLCEIIFGFITIRSNW